MMNGKRLLIIVIIMGLVGLAITQGLIVSSHAIDQSDVATDHVIILGAKLEGDQPMLALQYRLDKALDYLLRHPESVAICSGGQGSDELVSEAYAMGQWLEKKGISKDRILLEQESKNTFENIHFSGELIRQRDGSSRVAIVTSGYHLYRANMLAERHGLDPILVAAKTPGVILVQSYVRESLALIKSYLLDR